MCGIAGWFGANLYGDADVLVESLHHRGPDGSGVWQSGSATLVHTRLSILDLSAAGTQPMEWSGSDAPVVGEPRRGDAATQHEPRDPQDAQFCVRNRAAVVAFNGEIYNYRELRAELEIQGERFVSNSDTEVLLRLLVREGAAALPKLAGMFAFAFWNEETREGLLGRDAYGIKLLYYRQDAVSLAFASEAHVLGKDDDATDVTALRDFFLWGSVPEPATLNSAVRQLPAGHLMRWREGKVEVHRWYDPRLRRSTSPADPVTATREALCESMRRHLVSDVPVGIFLSGGIDSTVVLALAREELGPGADLRTFSIGFEDPVYDESAFARRTAEHFGARHTEWKMTSEEGAAEIPAFLAAVDQPSIDGFNTWCVSKLARREGMKVVLSGLGGDEWFAGYGSFQRVPQFRRLHRLLGPLRPIAVRLLEIHPVGSPWRRLASFLQGDGSWLEAFHVQRGIFTPREAAELASSLSGQVPIAAAWDAGELPGDPQSVVSWLEITRYMRNQLLRDSDIFSMAHGLELRVPLVDVRLAETLFSLSPTQRLRAGKQLLLEAVPEIPEWVRNQPKRGFRFPFQQWMEGGFGDLLASARQTSPVPLKAWYRTWAVAAALKALKA